MSSTSKPPKCSKCDCLTYTYMGLLGLDQSQICRCCDDGAECPKASSWTKYLPDFDCSDLGQPNLPLLDLGLLDLSLDEEDDDDG
jgi:hypothetical protein